MKRLLVATDFSERSDRAIRRATLLAKQAGASLSLVHVVDDDQPRRMLQAEQEAARAVLEEQSRSLQDVEGLACTARVLLGDPFEVLTQAARDDESDMLIVGPHRRQALRDVFVGTTAERTIRISDRPVLMANGTPAGPYRHILVAIDFSACSGGALRAVQNLGLGAKAGVSVVHIYDTPASGLVYRASSTEDEIESSLIDEEERAAGELAAYLKDFPFEPLQQLVKRNDSTVADSINAAARETSADLIVVGTRGRSGIVKALLGSVAQEVLRSAERDVLAVPPKTDR